MTNDTQTIPKGLSQDADTITTSRASRQAEEGIPTVLNYIQKVWLAVLETNGDDFEVLSMIRATRLPGVQVLAAFVELSKMGAIVPVGDPAESTIYRIAPPII